jgi:16S rRNA (guanine527-N7)-methyltransferase
VNETAGIDSIRDRVERCARAFEHEVTDEAIVRLTDWVTLLDRTNQRIDLTAARNPDELVDLMLADAFMLASRIPESATVVDVGTGAGAPGFPLAVVRRDLEIVLVEPMDKRVAFLRTSIGTVLPKEPKLPRVVRGRGESLVGKETFRVALSRATLPPPEWLALGRTLAPDGDVWVFLARGEPPAASPKEAVDYAWPLTRASRTALRY